MDHPRSVLIAITRVGSEDVAPGRDAALETVIDKALKLRALHRAKERVRQLERELRGELVKPEKLNLVPEFLRAPLSSTVVSLTRSKSSDSELQLG